MVDCTKGAIESAILVQCDFFTSPLIDYYQDVLLGAMWVQSWCKKSSAKCNVPLYIRAHCTTDISCKNMKIQKAQQYKKTHNDSIQQSKIITEGTFTNLPFDQCSTQEKIRRVRAKYAHLEPKAFVEFNRRLKSHALSANQWSLYLDKIIRDEALTSPELASQYVEWLKGLNI